MKNLKNIITGILSVAVFFMATPVSMAQEVEKAAKDKAEVRVSSDHAAFVPLEKIENGIKQTNYHWFSISGNYSPSAEIDPDDAQFLNYGPTPSTTVGCSGSMYLCVGGFTDEQVTTSNELNGEQEATEKTHRKN